MKFSLRNVDQLTDSHKKESTLTEWAIRNQKFWKTGKRVEEATGVWLECDTSATEFDRCLFHQAADDNLDYDQNGFVSERGLVRIYSPPQHQWGSRCLSIRFKTSTSITVAVSGTYVDEGQGYTTFSADSQEIPPTVEPPTCLNVGLKSVGESLIKKTSQVLIFHIIEKEFILMAKLNSIS